MATKSIKILLILTIGSNVTLADDDLCYLLLTKLGQSECGSLSFRAFCPSYCPASAQNPTEAPYCQLYFVQNAIAKNDCTRFSAFRLLCPQSCQTNPRSTSTKFNTTTPIILPKDATITLENLTRVDENPLCDKYSAATCLISVYIRTTCPIKCRRSVALLSITSKPVKSANVTTTLKLSTTPTTQAMPSSTKAPKVATNTLKTDANEICAQYSMARCQSSEYIRITCPIKCGQRPTMTIPTSKPTLTAIIGPTDGSPLCQLYDEQLCRFVSFAVALCPTTCGKYLSSTPTTSEPTTSPVTQSKSTRVQQPINSECNWAIRDGPLCTKESDSCTDPLKRKMCQRYCGVCISDQVTDQALNVLYKVTESPLCGLRVQKGHASCNQPSMLSLCPISCSGFETSTEIVPLTTQQLTRPPTSGRVTTMQPKATRAPQRIPDSNLLCSLRYTLIGQSVCEYAAYRITCPNSCANI